MTVDSLQPARQVFRVIGVAIALLAAVDPHMTMNRATKPVVALVAAPGADSTRVKAVEHTLAKDFVVTHGIAGKASAAVVVGDVLPGAWDELPARTFAVLEDSTTPRVAVEQVAAPEWIPRAARATLLANVHVTAARGRSLEIAATSHGLTVDHVTRTIDRDDARLEIPLGFVPTAIGPSAVRVSAIISGTRDTTASNAVIDVRDVRWSVLFYDPRPSWMSTFVRRALEQDPRFAVTSRVATSRGVSTDAGHAPTRLDDLNALSAFDVVIVGAPDALTDQEVSALDALLRRRAGRVILLPDHRAPGSFERLIGAPRMSVDSGKAVAIVSGADTLRAAELAWPSTLPPGASPSGLTTDGRPVVWTTAVGSGSVVVNGAFDAWRFRDASVSRFDDFWRTTIARAAVERPPALMARMTSRSLRPGERATVHVELRDAALSMIPTVHANAHAAIDGGSALHLLAAGDAGDLEAELVAPTALGVHHLVVDADSMRADVPFVVEPGAVAATAEHRDLVASFAASSGGRAIDTRHLDELPEMISAAVQPPSEAATWYPMRSPWWIIPLTLALCAEWWLRRRRGLR